MGFGNPLTAAQLAAAIASTTLTVTGTVTTTPTTPTPGTEDDDVRFYSQTTIDGLSTADKSTNFAIWNTTTKALNICENGAIVVPAVPTPTALTGRTVLNGYTVPMSSGTYATYTLALSRAVSAATVQIAQNSGFGLQFDVNSTDPLLTRFQTMRSSNDYTTNMQNLSTAGTNVGFALNDSGPTTRPLLLRNARFAADFKSITWEWAVNAGFNITLGSDTSIVWTAT